MSNIAVYWDFENIHASLCTREMGPKWYKENFNSKQPYLVDINSIMQYIAELGNVNVNRAYANWSFLKLYSSDLQNYAIDLIQLFPRGRFGKNGSDIRMAIEIIEDIANNPHVDIVVLIGGDSDYISVAQKVRQKGKSIIGIGVQETTNQYWVKSCNEFKYYSSLLVKSSMISDLEAEGYEIGDLDEAKSLLKRALEAGTSGGGRDGVLKAALKPLMLRFEPSFDETNYGFTSFSEFVASFSDIIEIVQGEHDHLVRLKKPLTNESITFAASEAMPSNRYESILRKQKVRTINPELLDAALNEVFEMLHDSEINNIAFKPELVTRMTSKASQFTETDAAKVKALLYKATVFRYLPNNKSTLISEIESAEELIYRVRLLLLSRIVDNISDDNIDELMLSDLIFGDKNHVADIQLLMAEYNR